MPIPTRNFYLVEEDTLPHEGGKSDYINFHNSYSSRKSPLGKRNGWQKVKKNNYSFYDKVNLN